jgi:hypothetical protein
MFSKLAHPVEDLLKKLPRVNGLDVKQLLVFLSEAIRIRGLSMLTDSQGLELIFPYCQDALARKVVMALQEGWVFERFHRDLLDSFIPDVSSNNCDARNMTAYSGRRNRLLCILIPSRQQRWW